MSTKKQWVDHECWLASGRGTHRLPCNPPVSSRIMIGMALPPFVQGHLQWFVCGLIVLLGLVAYGMFDLVRLSGRRMWAISSVCFAESYRRRVLLITPLAIVGVFIVSQLMKPTDEADAVRQTIKFCLFTTGLL